MRDWVVTSVDVSVEPKTGWDCVVAAGAEVRQPVHGIQLDTSRDQDTQHHQPRVCDVAGRDVDDQGLQANRLKAVQNLLPLGAKPSDVRRGREAAG